MLKSVQWCNRNQLQHRNMKIGKQQLVTICSGCFRAQQLKCIGMFQLWPFFPQPTFPLLAFALNERLLYHQMEMHLSPETQGRKRYWNFC